MFSYLSGRLGTERAGLIMIVASMGVIAIIITLLFFFAYRNNVADLHARGSSVVRLLSGVPYEQLSDSRNMHGPLNVLSEGQAANRFAYAVVMDEQARVLNRSTAPGFDVSNIAFPRDAPNWFGSRHTESSTGLKILEFFAPVIRDGNRSGTVRVGYFTPDYFISEKQLPFLGMVALPIFLLTPLFYFLMRREIRPLYIANEEIAKIMHTGAMTELSIEPGGELQDFITKFNYFIETVREKINVLEQDNTEMLASQKLLSYRKLRVESVLQALPDAIIVLGDDGRVTYANDKVETMLGVTPAEIMHRPPSEWCTHKDVMQFMARFETNETSKLFADTFRLRVADVAQKRLSVRAFPLFALQAPDTLFGRLIIISDATKDALAEESRANFVAHVAHELKTPLNALALYSEALLNGEGEDESFRIEALNVIHDETERLAALVNNLLNITKIEMGSLRIEKGRIRPKDLLMDAFNQFSHHAKDKNIELSLELPGEMSALVLDKDLFRIAVNNLLSNAIKYSPNGGQVTLAAIETDEQVEIRIADTGIGIAAEHAGKIFEKFYRAETEEVASIGGHGLGLPLAKEIVQLHRGTLEVESEIGKGSTFIIRLWKDSGLLKQAI